MEQDIEAKRFELEKEPLEGELKMKAVELDLRRAELEFQLESSRKHSLSSSPLTIAIITGIVGLVSIGIANYLQGRANLELEREKAESALIVKAIETGDREVAAKNLTFLVQIGLIQDKTGRIAALRESSLNAPVLPRQGRSFNPKKDCGLWQSETSQKRYTFICSDANSFDVYLNNASEGLVKVGTGNFDGPNVEADLYVLTKNRSAHLSLRLSEDGETLAGTWRGEDEREIGQLIFRKLK